MASKRSVDLLKKGSGIWNAWRRSRRNFDKMIDLTFQDLSNTDLSHADLSGTDLSNSDLSNSNLSDADLSWSRLIESTFVDSTLFRANLEMSICGDADFSRANLREAGLSGAHLGGANLTLARLHETELESARFANSVLDQTSFAGSFLCDTLFSSVNLSTAVELESCIHRGPSVVDIRTLQLSGPLPVSFMRGIGLSEIFIEYLPSLTNSPIQMSSCFISYSNKDRIFAERLYADLQNRGIRCWFAPHDLPIGAKIWDSIDQAIQVQDKLIIILSKNSVPSDWVEDEVIKAFAEERRRKKLVLVPIRIDKYVMTATEAWAAKLRDQRNIGDFSQWKSIDFYELSLGQLLKALTRELDVSSRRDIV